MTAQPPKGTGDAGGRRKGLRLRPSRALFAFAGLLVAMVAVAAWLILSQSRAKHLADAEREVIDLLLLAMIEELRPGIRDPNAVHQILRTRIADAPQVRGVIIVGPDGIVRHESRRVPAQPVDVSERAYFLALRDTATAGPYVGPPIQTRVDGKLVITLSRRLNGPNGEFDGVISIALAPEYFLRLYDELDPEHRTVISLVREDGMRLIRHPERDGLAGERVSKAAAVATRLATQRSATFQAASARTGEMRIYSYRALDNLPIYLLVSIAEDAALAGWRREAIDTVLGALLMTLLLGGLVFGLGRQVARGEALSEKLRVSEARFRDFTEATSDWLWEQDEQLRFSYLSEEVFNKSGLPVASHIGKTRREVIPTLTDEEWAAHQADLDARRPFRNFRFKRIGVDGQSRYVSTSGKPVFDEKGVFRGYRGTARDITEEIHAEVKLREAKAEAEAASAAKGEFLAVMSHELRTPLNAIIGFSEIISGEVLGPVGSERYRGYAGDILHAGHHLLGLINDILDMSKIEARQMELHESVFDIAAATMSCVRLMRQRAGNGGVALANAVPPDLPRVRGDEMRIRQVILNILSNAVKFTPPEGEVELRAKPLDEGGLELSIQDHGIGMTADEIAIALQPFRQVESAANRTHEGTGLGLPLAKALIELHGGSLVIASTPGDGTLVRIVLPSARVLDLGHVAAAD
jgi:PAS domain S-box-containing protein